MKFIGSPKYFLEIFNGKPSDKYLLRDGHHLNLMGYQLIYKRIKSIIKIN